MEVRRTVTTVRSTSRISRNDRLVERFERMMAAEQAAERFEREFRTKVEQRRRKRVLERLEELRKHYYLKRRQKGLSIRTQDRDVRFRVEFDLPRGASSAPTYANARR